MASSNEVVPSLLTSWKDIAQYLRKGVRTAQRWEQELGLPVLRPTGIGHKCPVAAHRSDLDAWLRERWSARTPRQTLPKSTSPDDKVRDYVVRLNESIQEARRLRSTHRTLVAEIRQERHRLLERSIQLTEALRRQGDAISPKIQSEERPKPIR